MINFRGTSPYLTTFFTSLSCTISVVYLFNSVLLFLLHSTTLFLTSSGSVSSILLFATTQCSPKWSNYFADECANSIDMPDVYFMTHCYPILFFISFFLFIYSFCFQCHQKFKFLNPFYYVINFELI